MNILQALDAMRIAMAKANRTLRAFDVKPLPYPAWLRPHPNWNR